MAVGCYTVAGSYTDLAAVGRLHKGDKRAGEGTGSRTDAAAAARGKGYWLRKGRPMEAGEEAGSGLAIAVEEEEVVEEQEIAAAGVAQVSVAAEVTETGSDCVIGAPPEGCYVGSV